jgi:hypothetical protein
MNIKKVDKIPEREETRGRNRKYNYTSLSTMREGEILQVVLDKNESLYNVSQAYGDFARKHGLKIRIRSYKMDNFLIIMRI